MVGLKDHKTRKNREWECQTLKKQSVDRLQIVDSYRIIYLFLMVDRNLTTYFEKDHFNFYDFWDTLSPSFKFPYTFLVIETKKLVM